MVGRDGVVKLLDLGLALFSECDENLTQGASLGSLGYIAPEQARDGHSVDARADIYSLGATIYFGLTGRAPNPKRGIADTPSPPARADTESDFERLLTIIQQMMASEPGDRFQTAIEVIEAVTEWFPAGPPAGPFPTPSAPIPVPASLSVDSTEFTLSAEHNALPVVPDSPSEPSSPTGTDFVFESPRQAAASPKPKSPVRPAPEPEPTPPPARSEVAKHTSFERVPASESWVTRYWWVLMLAALVIGFGSSYLVREKRETAMDQIRRSAPRPVTPNSP
jgi:serine/threonine protein kinase